MASITSCDEVLLADLGLCRGRGGAWRPSVIYHNSHSLGRITIFFKCLQTYFPSTVPKFLQPHC